MDEPEDIELLQRYTAERSEDAFAALIARHMNKVYSVALRHAGNASQAEEITQAVFVLLARKARSLSRSTILSAWLYKAARLTALTFVRSEMRRARREQEAQMQSMPDDTPSETWEQMAPLLDAAMAELGAKDRAAIVLRFFDGKSLDDVATALAASEEAAKKRVARAVEKLRLVLRRRGLAVPSTVLVAALSAHAVQAAPAHLLPATLAAAAAQGTAACTSTLTLIKGPLSIMAWTNTKTAIVATTAGLLTLGTTTLVVVKTDGFGLWSKGSEVPAMRAKADPARRVFTDGINKAHRIPDPLYTYPEGDEGTRRYVEAVVERFRRELDVAETIKSDRELTGEDITNRTIYIYGSPQNHSLFRRVREQLPLVFEDDGIVVGSRKCLGQDVGAIFVCPNPFNPEHRFVVYGAVSPAALKDMNGVFHGPTDFVVFNNTTRQLAKRQMQSRESSECFLVNGAFDRSDPAVWRVDDELCQRPSGELLEATRDVVVARGGK